MNISHRWLENYLPDLHQFKPKQIAEVLTTTLAEVEGIEYIGNKLDKIVVGEVISVEEHPTLKKLKICTVNIGADESTIITGAPNIAVKQKVAVCLPQGSIYNPKQPLRKQDPIEIGEREMGGILSEGMICSAKELGLGEDHEGIMVLESEIEPGTNIAETLRDIVYEIENKSISHRPDCFSHYGIARELSVILNIDLVEPKFDTSVIPTSELELKIDKKVDDEMCSRFTAVVLKDVIVKDSPLWLKARLSAVGVRSINNVVDTTNYVMMDIGQPLHAFDYDKLKAKKLTVKYARKGDTIKALDEQTYKLDEQTVIISVNDKPESIAGIMGGSITEISAKTTNIVIEGANWNMYNIRRTSRNLGLRTEASTRFEKGQDPSKTDNGVKAALDLIVDLTGAEVASDLIDIYNKPRETHEAELKIPSIKRFLGIELSRSEIISILTGLKLELLQQEETGNLLQNDRLRFRVPTFRPDLRIEQDLLEEIARIYGYERIPATLPERMITPSTENKVSVLSRIITRALTAVGMDEVMTYSFVGEDLYKKSNLNTKNLLSMENPISPELSYLRSTLIPSLLEKVTLNTKNFSDFSYFEIGRAIQKELDENGVHTQPRRVAGLTYDQNKDEIYYQTKAKLEALFSKLNLDVKYTELEKSQFSYLNEMLHGGRTALIKCNSKVIGVVGEVHPQVINNFEIEGRLGVFELDFDLIEDLYDRFAEYKALSDFQKVTRDFSFWVSPTIGYSQFEDAIRDLQESLIVDVSFIDEFHPKDNPKQKGITFSITLQSPAKTLEEKEIATVTDNVIKAIESTLKAELRK